jgi:hypothetical protein
MQFAILGKKETNHMVVNNDQRYLERKQRITDAIALRVPDRVPATASAGFFAARYAGFTCRDIMYDKEKAAMATLKFLEDFQPDLGDNPFMSSYMAAQLEAVGYNRLAWPGHGLSDTLPFQFLEKELMPAEDYDDYLYDPTDYVIRKIWPRVFDHLKPLEKIPPLQNVVDYVGLNKLVVFADPEVQVALAAMVDAGKKIQASFGEAIAFGQKVRQMGFYSFTGSGTLAPFDFISDLLRGTRGAMLDMIRVPDKLQAMIEKVYPIMLGSGLTAKQGENRGVFIPLHKCLDRFMSQKQFKTFYWPSLKKMLDRLIAEGLTPVVFWEGDCTSRLEVIGDLAPGKAIYQFEQTNLFRAKDIIGDVVCLQGNVPLSLLVGGTPDDVKAYCKDLIDDVGKGGGFILSPSTSLDNAKPENVKAMFDFTKSYGVYG